MRDDFLAGSGPPPGDGWERARRRADASQPRPVRTGKICATDALECRRPGDDLGEPRPLRACY